MANQSEGKQSQRQSLPKASKRCEQTIPIHI